MNKDTRAVPYYSIPPIENGISPCGDSRNGLANSYNSELPPIECGYFKDNRIHNSKALARVSIYEAERRSGYYNQPTDCKLS